MCLTCLLDWLQPVWTYYQELQLPQLLPTPSVWRIWTRLWVWWRNPDHAIIWCSSKQKQISMHHFQMTQCCCYATVLMMFLVSAADRRRLLLDHCVWPGKLGLLLYSQVLVVGLSKASQAHSILLFLQFALSAVLSIARSISSRGKRDDFDDFN